MGLDTLPQIGFLLKTLLGIGIVGLLVVAIVYYVYYVRAKRHNEQDAAKEYQEYVATSIIFSILLIGLYIVVAIFGPVFSLIIS